MSRIGGRRNRRRRPKWDLWGTVRARGTLVLAGVVGVVVAVGSPNVWQAVRQHPYFALRDVIIEQPGHVSDRAIRRAAGLTVGMSIWDVDAAAVEAQLELVPWVRSARVGRELPRRVTVHIDEYRPVAIVHVSGAEAPLHYVAETGRVFAPVGPHDGRDLPYLTGMDAEAIRTGAAEHAIRTALDVVRLAAAYQDALGVVSEVRIDLERGVTLMPMRPAVPIELGWDDAEVKLARVAEVLQHWHGHVDAIRSVRSASDGEVVVRLRDVPPEWGT